MNNDAANSDLDAPPLPPLSRIECSFHANGVTLQIPQAQRIFWPAALQAVVVLGIAAGLTQVVLERRLFWAAAVGSIVLTWLAGIFLAVRSISRMRTRGAIAISGDTLAVIEHRMLRRFKRAWSIKTDVIDAHLSIDENSGTPLGLIINTTELKVFEFFHGLSAEELNWLAAVVQQEIERAQLRAAEKKLGLPNKPVEEWTDADFTFAMQRMDAVSAEMDRGMAEMTSRMSQLEFGLTKFEEWQPGKRIELKREQPTALVAAGGALGGVIGSAIVYLFIAPFATPLLGFVIQLSAYLFPPAMRRNVSWTVADVFAFGGGNVAWMYFSMLVISVAVLMLKLDAAFTQREVVIDWTRRLVSVITPRSEQSYSLPSIKWLQIRTISLPDNRAQSDDSDEDASEEAERRLSQIVARFPEGEVVIVESDKSSETDEEAQERIHSMAEELAAAIVVPLEVVEMEADEFDAAGYPRKWKLKYLPRVWRMASVKSRWIVVAAVLIVLVVYAIRLQRAYAANVQENAAAAIGELRDVSPQSVYRRA